MTTNGLAEVFKSYTWYGTTLRAVREHPDGGRDYAQITWAPLAPGSCMPEDSIIELSEEGTQRLMDSLWSIGIRPSGKLSQSDTVLRATRDHLEDMRKLVFKEK